MTQPQPPHGTYAPGWGARGLLALSRNTPLGRGFSRKVMAGFVRGLSADILDTRLFGQNARLHMRNNSSEVKALMNPARYSHAEFAFAAEYMPVIEGVFVDIGANAGLFSLGLASLIDTGTVLAFEPQPTLFARLRANLVELNPELISRVDVRLFEMAIGGQEGRLDLYVPAQLGQASARLESGGEVLNAPMRALCDVLREENIAQIDLLKLDVEGFEDEVLTPFFASAPEILWPRTMIVEHCHKGRWAQDCEAVLLERGYRVVHMDRTNMMLVREGI